MQLECMPCHPLCHWSQANDVTHIDKPLLSKRLPLNCWTHWIESENDWFCITRVSGAWLSWCKQKKRLAFRRRERRLEECVRTRTPQCVRTMEDNGRQWNETTTTRSSPGAHITRCPHYQAPTLPSRERRPATTLLHFTVVFSSSHYQPTQSFRKLTRVYID